MGDFNDDVNFNALTKEMSTAISQDNKYQRENDAKFRAIHQKVQSYDEFRDIVEASHLTSLDKSDKIGGMNYQKWNTISSGVKTAHTGLNQTHALDSSSQQQPRNSREFVRSWKRNASTSVEQFDYLLSLEDDVLRKCLMSDCLLGEIVSVVHACLEQVRMHEYRILNIFEIISKTERFSLDLEFLSNKQNLQLKQIFDKFQTAELQPSDKLFSHVQALKSVYRLS